MKTTLDIDDSILRQAKQRAAAAGTTLRAYVEDALRAQLTPRRAGSRPFKFRPILVSGTAPPAIDIADRDQLYDFIEGRR